MGVSQSALGRFFERRMAVERRNVIVHILPLAFKVIGNSDAQALMGDVVRRMGAFGAYPRASLCAPCAPASTQAGRV